MGRRTGPSTIELVGLGGTAAGCIAAGVGVGYWIGTSTSAGVVATFAGLTVGLAAAVAATVFKIKRYL